MAFLEQRLDVRIERGARGGPANRGRTRVVTRSGRSKSNFLWSQGLRTWEVQHGIRSAADAEALLALWHVVNFTPYEGFLFRDWSDYRASQTNSTLTLISGTSYQLQRAYTFASITHKRDIKKPDAGVVIYDAGGSPLTATVDATTGVASVPSGTPAYWVGTFNVPVFFATDEWVYDLEPGSPGAPAVILPTVQIEELRL